MNYKLFEEVLKFLVENNTGENININHILKAGNYKPGDIASTLGYMVDHAMIGGCLYQNFNKNDPKTNKRHTVDSVEIKTRILPAGAKYYNDTFKKVANQGPNIHAENSQINYTNVEGGAGTSITVQQTTGEGKASSLERWYWIVGIILALITIITSLATCEEI